MIIETMNIHRSIENDTQPPKFRLPNMLLLNFINDISKDFVFKKLVLPLSIKILEIKFHANNSDFDLSLSANFSFFENKISTDAKGLHYRKSAFQLWSQF